ncbi:MAG: hypothetical protein J2P57_05600 [Acidimicrobiaceae bacterium]|nr:hypothetical protein [Acidimicrobiaceae bacterium]
MSYQRVHQIVDVRSGKGAIRESPDKRVCSFCGASARQIRRLIAGPHVYICNRCIDLANAVRTRGVPVGDEWTRMDPETDPEARCSFCGKARRDTTGMVVVAEAAPPAQRRRGRRSALRRPSGVRECAECLDLCNQVMAEPEH